MSWGRCGIRDPAVSWLPQHLLCPAGGGSREHHPGLLMEPLRGKEKCRVCRSSGAQTDAGKRTNPLQKVGG